MGEHKNTIIAIVLSLAVMVGWQILVGYPQMKKEQEQARLKQQEQSQVLPGQTQPGQPQGGNQAQSGTAGPAPEAPGLPSAAAPSQAASRESIIGSTPRVAIDTPRLGGSIDLKGGRIDDLTLTQYRETIDPNSPPIVLFSPSGAPDAYYAEFGWVPTAGSNGAMPGPDTVWQQQGSGALSINHPVTLTYDNGQGLVFTRTIAIDDRYMFSIKDSIANKGSVAVTLFPYALISRHGTPEVLGYYILHEGLIGVIGEHGEQTQTYKKMQEQKSQSWDATNVWLGFTDKYFAAALVPDTDAKVRARFSAGDENGLQTYQTDYLAQPVTVAAGATGLADTRLFAGAKEVSVVGIDFPLGPGGYNAELKLNKFDLLIDWGWFYFITKPMFLALDYFYHVVGNFGIAILIVTVIVKLLFFPLANKSYASMAKMKAVQPQMAMIKERYADDRVKQQQAMMELYKKEQINPIAGCLPIAIQIPVFFSLYKVLFITIEMRHAPFYGWIHDLSAQDPTNIFTLGGLIPFDPTIIPMIGSFLHLGFWPAIMGVTMWMQMKLNPAPPDPTQQVIFNWMPLIFTFMLAKFPAGLVIYWAWNNSLSVAQQSVIMHRNGAKIELWDNLKNTFVRTKPKAPPAE
ncbi:MAG TPA: membrane protein insertase YidC [Xanthobacteraceae bacterium]|jgi:YidC/Oxa1 family membrane protein insertase|nr:membrane protein insertase YidC [Xanthobacteraceae bacterium]